MLRIATSPRGLGWSPAEFWGSTLAEYHLALEAAQGRFGDETTISREDMAFYAKAHGKRPSIRKQG